MGGAVELDGDARSLTMTMEPAAIAAAVAAAQQFILQEVESLRRDGAAVGLSGGLDSAVVATLAARALGPRKVLALIMPDRDSDPQSMKDALELVEQLGISHKAVNLTHILSHVGLYRLLPLRLVGWRGLQSRVVRWFHRRYAAALGEQPFDAMLEGTRDRGTPLLDRAIAYHRVKNRLRMMLTYYHAEQQNLLVLGTCNRTELQVGLFVKYGDGAADAMPIGVLYKTQVRQLGAYLGIPRSIQDKAPSPDLLPGLTDEDILGLTYDLLDQVLLGLEQEDSPMLIAARVGLTETEVRRVADLVRRSAPMRRWPPIGPWEPA